MSTVPLMAAGMSDEQQAIFYAQVGAYEKDEVAGVLLALFFGCFGAHHFYLRRNGLGVAYLLFFWTGITAILGVIECFFMPSRVQRYNLEQAVALAAQIRGASPPPATLLVPALQASAVPRACPSCGADVAPGVRFCARCGAAVL